MMTHRSKYYLWNFIGSLIIIESALIPPNRDIERFQCFRKKSAYMAVDHRRIVGSSKKDQVNSPNKSSNGQTIEKTSSASTDVAAARTINHILYDSTTLLESRPWTFSHAPDKSYERNENSKIECLRAEKKRTMALGMVSLQIG